MSIIQRFLLLAEFEKGVHDAEHALTHPTTYWSARILKDLVPEWLSSSLTAQAGGIYDASTAQGLSNAHQVFVSCMKYLSEKQTEEHIRIRGGNTSQLTTTELLAKQFGRPLSLENIELIPHHMTPDHIGVPSYKVDLNAERMSFLEEVARTMNTMTLNELLYGTVNVGSGARGTSGGTRTTQADQKAAMDERQSRFQQSRRLFNLLFGKIYDLAFARIDMAIYHDIMERYTNNEIAMVAEALRAPRPFPPARDDMQARVRFADIVTSAGARKRRRLQLQQETGEPEDEETRRVTIKELRESIRVRMHAKEYLQAKLVFSTDAKALEDQEESPSSLLRPTEQLSPEVQQQRLNLFQAVGGWAQNGAVSESSLIDTAKNLFGLELNAAPAEELLRRGIVQPKEKKDKGKK